MYVTHNHLSILKETGFIQNTEDNGYQQCIYVHFSCRLATASWSHGCHILEEHRSQLIGIYICRIHMRLAVIHVT